MSNNVINSDIYDIMNTTNELQKKFMEDEFFFKQDC